MAAITTAAVLLRAHRYGDTSSVLRFWTESHGLVSVMARGVRGRTGRGGATLDTFASGTLTAWMKPGRDLQTMKDFADVRVRSALGASLLRLAAASAAAELLLVHSDQDPHPGLLNTLEWALDALETADAPDVAVTAVLGLWRLVEALGYAPELDRCVACGKPLEGEGISRFDHSAGGLRCELCAEGSDGPRVGPRARAQLRTLLDGAAPADFGYPRRHVALLSDFIAYHVAPRPLKSLAYLRDSLPVEES